MRQNHAVEALQAVLVTATVTISVIVEVAFIDGVRAGGEISSKAPRRDREESPRDTVYCVQIKSSASVLSPTAAVDTDTVISPYTAAVYV